MKAKIVIIIMLLAGINSGAQTCFDVKQIGGTGDDGGSSIAIDSAGNVYITGFFSGTVDFDPGTGVDNHTSNGNWDIYLCKFDAGGNFLLARTWGSNSMDRGAGIAIDRWNNVYVVGPFQGTADFDPGPGVDNHTSNAGTMNNPFISKFDANGNFKWARTWGTANCGSEAYSCAVDKFGNVYAVGDFCETLGVPVDFDPGNSVDNHFCNGAFDAWIVKYDSLGNYQWGNTWGGDSYDDGPSVAVDDGGVYDAGMYMSLNCDFDPGAGTDIHSSNGDIDVFINKFDLNGNHIWTKTWGGTGADDAGKIITDGAGHFYVAGYFTGTADFDPGPGTFNLTGAGGIADIFISKFDTTGNFKWAETMGGAGEDKGFALTWDGGSSLFSSGYFTGTADFDPGPGTANLTSAGSYDVFVCKLDTAGNFFWAKQMGGTGDDKGISCSFANMGNLYILGGFSATADFDPDAGIYNLTSLGGTDIFIDKIYDCPTGIANDQAASGSSTVFPNPFISATTIKISSSVKIENAELKVFDVLGNEVRNVIGINSNEIVFRKEKLTEGVYFYSLSRENIIIAKGKFIIE